MEKKQAICCFDFDGTLTKGDSLLYFIRFACGTRRFVFGLALYSPFLVLMKLRILPNWHVKQMLFRHYFEGMRIRDFDNLCKQFALKFRCRLRPKGMDALRRAKQNGVRVLIVSASIDNWVGPCIGTDGIEVLGTRIESVNGRLTGRFLSKNCYGVEKVNRIKMVLSDCREQYYITAYGDSRGDKEMMAYADKAYYKPFRDNG